MFADSIPENFTIKYWDDENDLVSITCDRELAEAIAFASGKPLLRLTIVENTPKIKPADSKPASATPTAPAKEEPKRPQPIPHAADPIIGIIEQALNCPELQGLIGALGFTPEAVRNIISSFQVPPNRNDQKEKEKESSEDKKSENEDGAVHNAFCDHCDAQIRGIRYKCTICHDYDLCSACEALLPSAAVHDTQHLFLKVCTPVRLPSRRPLLPNFYVAEASGGCPYRRWGHGGWGRGPAQGHWGGRRCYQQQQQPQQGQQQQGQWQRNHCAPVPAPAAPCQETPVVEGGSRWQRFLSSRFIADVTINDGTQMAPRTPFHKVWRLKNAGSTEWPANTALTFVSGDSLGGEESVVLQNPVQPGEEVEVGVNMVAPARAGRYISNFRLVTPDGISFGHRVWADILVVPPADPTPVVVVEEQASSPLSVEVEVQVVEEEEVEKVKEEEPQPVPAEVVTVVAPVVVEPVAPQPAPVHSDYIYGGQLAALVGMGFENEEANKIALWRHKGDIIAAVNDLLG